MADKTNNEQPLTALEARKQAIKSRIKETGFSVVQIAEKLGTSQQNLAASLNSNPKLSRLQEIADVIGVPVSRLVSDVPLPDAEPKMRCPHCGVEIEATVKLHCPSDVK